MGGGKVSELIGPLWTGILIVICALCALFCIGTWAYLNWKKQRSQQMKKKLQKLEHNKDTTISSAAVMVGLVILGLMLTLAIKRRISNRDGATLEN